MILPIVNYGHPALRGKGKRIENVDAKIRRFAADMIETMIAHDGIGLAAHQVGLPIMLSVVDVSGVKKRPSALRIDGKTVDLESRMPLVLVNPEVEPFGEVETANEGCLSFPEVQGDVSRPRSVKVRAHTLDGEALEFEADGLLARAIQHEQDHLVGILFIDRMDPGHRRTLAPQLKKIQDAQSAAG